MILSNKMLLPLLWEGFPGHANLLAAFDARHADLGGAYVKKPIFGREGHNVTIVGPGVFDTAGGNYGSEGFVWQAYQPLPVFDGNHAMVGSWVIGASPPASACARTSGGSPTTTAGSCRTISNREAAHERSLDPADRRRARRRRARIDRPGR